MKTNKILFTALLAILFCANSFAQSQTKANVTDLKTVSLKVAGNCGMCETRIEKAAKIEGVSKADWNSETKILTLVYKPSKVKSDDIQKKLAAAGHDTPKFKATDKVYNALPGCCKYR